jgi:hypothetical protein
MLGHQLRWQQGFDCQGLWVEVEVEKELGFTSKRQLESYGVANFVNKCKERVYRFAVAIEGSLQVALDTTLTADLRREGLARDFVRAVQEARKSAGLALADRIALYLALPEDARQAAALRAMLDEWGGYIEAETLAKTLALGLPPAGTSVDSVTLDGMSLAIGVVRP